MQSEVRPKRGTKKSRSTNHELVPIKYIDSQVSAHPKQISAQTLHLFAVELVVAGNVYNGLKRKVATGPFNALLAKVNVARQDDDVSVHLRGRPVLKFKVQI